jgi:tetratricopeptide (TPR) repeat protein
MVTWIQVRYWQNSITLFDHTLNVTDNNYIIYNGRGTAYSNRGNYTQAIKDYDKVIEINPEYVGAYSNRGNVYLKLGNESQAEEDMKTAARLGNEYAQDLLKRKGIAW